MDVDRRRLRVAVRAWAPALQQHASKLHTELVLDKDRVQSAGRAAARARHTSCQVNRLQFFPHRAAAAHCAARVLWRAATQC